MQSYTFGTVPEHVIREAFASETRNGGGYVIEAKGIDAVTLTAATCSDGEWGIDELVGTLAALADFPESPNLPDDRYSASEVIENAFSLRTSILETLGIEEI